MKFYDFELLDNKFYDAINNRYFSLKTTLKNEDELYTCFICSKDEFKKQICYDYVDTEIAYQIHKDIDKFKNSKILIIGGGPSAINLSYKLDDYDFIWSCNNFFKNNNLINVKLATFGREVNLNDKNLHDYLNKYNTLCIFEPDHGMKYKFLPNSIFARLRYNGRIGSIPRLILYAIFWQVKQIDIIGMDGPSNTHGHFFENRPKFGGTIERTSKNMKEILHKYKIQYTLFWFYILNDLKTKVKFYNLSEDYPGNLLAPISRLYF